jgi:lysyl-tRNA synthetase, class I
MCCSRPGYGPSGLPHIGTFGEVLRTTMIRRAFEVISDIPTRLICFSDDLDGMRKVPSNVPDPEALKAHLQRPLTSVPDPFGTHESFGHHNNAMLRRFLDTFGFQYEFISARDFYHSGQFDATLLRAAERYDALMEVMLKSLRDERRETYSIFLPIHPETGRVLYVPIKHVDAAKGTITFDDEDGREMTLPVTGGNVKLQWKPDFGARWAALGVDFEMYGKDHAANTPIYDRICEILGGTKPNHFTYELFLDEQGHKISKSSGNGLTIDEWLTYAATDSLSYFMFLKPKTAKRMHFDVIPKMVDEYHQQLRAYAGQDAAERLSNPVFHIHGHNVPSSDMVVPFAMLLNLASVSGAEDKETLWGFIGRYAPEASAATHRGLDAAVGLCGSLLPRLCKTDPQGPRPRSERARGDGGSARPVARLGRRGRCRCLAKHGLCRGQGAWVRAAARLVQGAVRGAAGARPRGRALAGSWRCMASPRASS